MYLLFLLNLFFFFFKKNKKKFKKKKNIKKKKKKKKKNKKNKKFLKNSKKKKKKRGFNTTRSRVISDHSTQVASLSLSTLIGREGEHSVTVWSNPKVTKENKDFV